MIAFTRALRLLNHSLHTLALPHCSLKQKDICALVGGMLIQKYPLSAALKTLDLTGNCVGEEGSEMLGVWLSHLDAVCALERLRLSKCQLDVLPILTSLRVVRSFLSTSSLPFHILL